MSDSPPIDVTDEGVTWRIPLEEAPGGVRLEVDWILAGDPAFVRVGQRWTYDLDRPAACRLEYRLILRDADGHGDPGLDPTSPRHISNPFGGRSVIEFGDYAEPDWVGTVPDGVLETVDVPPGRLRTAIPSQLWTTSGLNRDEPAPLLVAHDGSGLADDAALLGWATWHGAVWRPVRVLLLDPAPGCRDVLVLRERRLLRRRGRRRAHGGPRPGGRVTHGRARNQSGRRRDAGAPTSAPGRVRRGRPAVRELDRLIDLL